MREAPESFQESLQKIFGGRLRIRWSRQRGEWHIEQKVRRGFVEGMRPTKRGWDDTNDNYVRYRDGYAFILSVRTGDRMPCPKCGHELKVPFMETHHVKCDYCALRGRQSFVAAVYMPLGDTLLDYLRKIDPENPISRRLAEDLDRQNVALAAAMEKKPIDDAMAGFSERYNRIVGNPQTGYTGKEFRG